MKTHKILHLLFLFAVPTRSSFGQVSVQQLDSLMNSYVRQRYFTGVVLLAKGDQILYHKAFGLADREKNIALQPTTNFSIASVGKIFTATLVMLLAKEGKIDVQKTVNDYLPEWNVPNGNRIRVHHLLTHTGYTGNYMVHKDYDKIRPTIKAIDTIMPLVVARALVRDTLGKEFRYSNSGYILLGKIAEKVTGLSFEKLMSERIFKPAEMTRTYGQPNGFQSPAEAVPYELFTDKTYISAVDSHAPALPDGSTLSNVVDLWKFSRWFLKAIPATTRQTMWTPHIQQKSDSYYGYGWVISEEYSRKQVSHDGGIGGWSADFRLVPEDEYAAIVLINQHLNPKDITRQMLNIAYTGNFEKPTREFVRSVIADIDHRGFGNVQSHFKTILQNGYDYKPRRGDVITLFNGLNELKRYEQVVALGRIAVEAFPKESWVYVALGDAYYGMNKTSDGKAAFEEALKIDPTDFWAKLMLEKIAR